MNIFEEFDQICSRHATFLEFCDSPDDVQAYFKKASSFFGETNFSTEDFAILLAQMKSVVLQDAKVGQLLWRENQHDYSFSLQLEEEFGRNIDRQAWETYRLELLQDLKSEFQSLYAFSDIDDVSSEAEKVLEEIAEDRRKNLKKLTSAAQVKYYFVSEHQRPDLNALAAAFLYFALSAKEALSFLSTAGASEVINFFADLARFEKWRKFSLSAELYKILYPIVRSKIPHKSDLQKRRDIFPIATHIVGHGTKAVPYGNLKAGVYHFLSSTRALHTIFLNVSTGDCTLRSSEEGCPSPLRWVCYLGDQTISYCISRAQNFYGSISFIPVVIDKVTWACVEPSSARLNRRTTVFTSDGKKTGYLFDHVIAQVFDKIPEDWAGLVISDFSNFDNYGTVEFFQQRLAGRYSRVMSSAVTLKVDRSLVEKLQKRFPLSEYIHKQSGAPVLSANLHHSRLRVIDRELQSQATTLERIHRLSGQFHNFSDFREQEGLQLNYFKSLQKVFGSDSIAREDFHAAIWSLTKYVTEYPTLEPLLWAETDRGHEFTIKALPTRPPGPLRTADELQKYQDLLFDLVTVAGPSFSGNAVRQRVERALRLQKRQIRSIEKLEKEGTVALDRLARVQRRLLAQHESARQKIGAALAYLSLQSASFEAFFKNAECQDLVRYLQNPENHLDWPIASLNMEDRYKLQPYFDSWIRRMGEIAGLGQTPVQQEPQTISFRPISRFIDRVMMGISRPSFRKIRGGTATHQIEKWGIELSGFCYAVFDGQKYLGGLRIYPYSYLKGETWGDVHFESTWFLRKSYQANSSEKESIYNFQLTVSALEKILPSHWVGLTTAVTLFSDDSGVAACIKQSQLLPNASFEIQAVDLPVFKGKELIKSIWYLRASLDKLYAPIGISVLNPKAENVILYSQNKPRKKS